MLARSGFTTIAIIAVVALVGMGQVEGGLLGRDEAALESASLSGGDGIGMSGTILSPEGFRLLGAHVEVSPHHEDATTGTPTLATPTVAAHTLLERDHWRFTAEVAPRSPVPGAYRASLTWNDVPQGTIDFLVESHASGVLVAAFDVGPALARSIAYVLTVERVDDLPTGGVEAHLRSGPSGAITWVDESGAANPTIQAKAGASVLLVWHNSDGVAHDLAVWDEQGRRVGGPTPVRDEKGVEETLSWVPARPGTYAYVCELHPAAMRGVIHVE